MQNHVSKPYVVQYCDTEIQSHSCRYSTSHTLFLLSIKDQSSNFDRLPMRGILGARSVKESRVRSQSSLVHLRIIALDQSDLFRSLIRKVMPLVVGIILHTEGATNSVGVDEPHGDQVVLGVKVTPVGDCEGLVSDWVTNRSPDVDDANAAFKESFGIFAEMTMHTSDTGVVGLVDMNAFLYRMVLIDILGEFQSSE